ncbi:response regulator transcription factor [Paraburkholderia sp. LEh10]|uniref:response regulator transcription factor n=1 Tax=Paraburkholderia sp. LEh10 TaxID=2821353 RepID=UPI001AE55BDE|nr:response regulator [Paraburkholderia sp. LEh10]MBP0589585.1 response regulator transcription factor [Paraburkholderia sp. LEh10]
MTTTAKSTSEDDEGPLTPSIVYIIDDDEDVRVSLGSLLRSVGHRVQVFSSPVEFLTLPRESIPSCLILDVRLRSESGLAFQQSLANREPPIPILIITGFPDVEMSVKAMKAGAMDFFPKPLREQDLLDAVTRALRRDAERLAFESSIATLRRRYESLTPKEHDVLEYVLAGLLNKQIADEMHLSEITIKMHRGQVMRKMGVGSLVDLTRNAQLLGVSPRPRRSRST